MRALLVTLPAFGHAAPLCAIGAALAAGGDQVAWVAHRGLGPRLLPAGAPRFDVPGPGPERAAPRGRPSAALRDWFGAVLGGAADRMVPVVREAIRAFRPDVVVVEQNALAGAIGAELAGLPWVCVHVTPMLLTAPWRVLPGLEAWVDDAVGQVFRAWGAAPRAFPLRSPHGTLIASSAAFLGPAAELRPGDELVGALIGARRAPAAAGAERPRIVVTLGTLTGAAGAGFLARAAALAALGRVTVLDAGPADPGWVDLPPLLSSTDLVVSHGGQNTVTEALAAGVPLVLAPVQYDQPVVAARVAALGAGVAVSWDRATAAELVDAARRVLGDPAYAAAARAVGATLPDGSALAAARVRAAAGG